MSINFLYHTVNNACKMLGYAFCFQTQLLPFTETQPVTLHARMLSEVFVHFCFLLVQSVCEEVNSGTPGPEDPH